MSYYVVIRGPLGVGKSTVSERLAKEIGGEHILIDRILEEHGWEEWDEDRISLKSFLRANAWAIERARGLLENGIPVVFDGNFYWRPAIDDLLQKLDFRHYVVTLEAPLSVCIQRDRQRPITRGGVEPRAGDSLGEEATTQVYGMVNQVRYGIAIDATGSVDAIVAAVLRHITDSRASATA